jgi:hypothetical protein
VYYISMNARFYTHSRANFYGKYSIGFFVRNNLFKPVFHQNIIMCRLSVKIRDFCYDYFEL